MASITYDSIPESLVEAIPEFRPVVEEHITYYDEVLQHVLFGDFTRFVLEQEHNKDEELVRRCLAFLDQAVRSGDELTENLVAVSFVENVGPWEPAMKDFISHWPESLQTMAREQGWQP